MGSSPYEVTTGPGGVYLGTHIGGDDVWLTTHHYDTIVSETRITSYLGIMTGQIPAQHYFAAWRTFPATCDWSWHEMQPVGVTRTYLGIDVYEGAYTYRGMHIVPGWGGSMFEELMPNVFVPEEVWGPRSWGKNHPLHVRAQIEHGMLDAEYGYWGFSPASDPFANYREYGVDALGLNPEGYFSDVEKTNYDPGFGNCRPATNPDPDYGDGVVTPHAPFLAMMHEPVEAFDNLVRLESEPRRLRSGWLLRRHRGEVEHRREAVPVPGPGDGHGGDRQRGRGQRPPAGLQHARGREGAAPRHRDGGVRRRAGCSALAASDFSPVGVSHRATMDDTVERWDYRYGVAARSRGPEGAKGPSLRTARPAPVGRSSPSHR